jgi:hypothetical protein
LTKDQCMGFALSIGKNMHSLDHATYPYGCISASGFRIYWNDIGTADCSSTFSCIQVYQTATNGCTDGRADNFDWTANVDDGSCVIPLDSLSCTELQLEYQSYSCCDNVNSTCQDLRDEYSTKTCCSAL